MTGTKEARATPVLKDDKKCEDEQKKRRETDDPSSIGGLLDSFFLSA